MTAILINIRSYKDEEVSNDMLLTPSFVLISFIKSWTREHTDRWNGTHGLL